MPVRRTVIRDADVDEPLRALRAELKVPGEFVPEVIAEATAAAASWSRDGRVDATDLELVTLDPTGSRDLDQAFAIEQTGDGYVFHYAIADVAAFVSAGGPMAAEAQVRGETLYLPDGRAPLYPPLLSDGAASLLPGGDRPAVLWRLELDQRAEIRQIEVRRAVVRSRQQLDYETIEQAAPQVATVLESLGRLRLQREIERGGVSLDVPEQEVVRTDGVWSLRYRVPRASEAWNAQLSLLVGMAAAQLMITAKVGLLRTMPRPPHHVVQLLRNSAAALHIDWPEAAAYPQIIRSLDPAVPAQAAMLRVASVAFRGAHYTAFDGELPPETGHSAVAAPYAHATAPLRRLADRYVSEVCLALFAKTEIPAWARDGLPGLPHTMATADEHAHRIDHAVVDLAEAVLLQDRIGETFAGVIVEVEDDSAHQMHGEIQIQDPAVHSRIDGSALPLGERVDARLATADVAVRKVTFVRA
jgi:exoribonuclease R